MKRERVEMPARKSFNGKSAKKSISAMEAESEANHLKTSFVEKIEAIMERDNVSLKELSSRVKMSVPKLRNILDKNNTDTSIKDMTIVASALQITMAPPTMICTKVTKTDLNRPPTEPYPGYSARLRQDAFFEKLDITGY